MSARLRPLTRVVAGVLTCSVGLAWAQGDGALAHEEAVLPPDAAASAYASAWDAPLMPVFEQSAGDAQVPQELLLVLAWLGSGFENRQGAPTIERGYGLMALRENAWGGDSLTLAARLTGLDVAQLKLDPAASIRGAAAVLDAYARAAGIDRRKGLEAWVPVVVRYAGLDDQGNQLFATQLYRYLQSGFETTNSLGETFVVAAQALTFDPDTLAPPQAQMASPDYPPATWDPAASCNYSTATSNKDTIIIHTAEGSYAGCISWFKNCASGVSSQYVVAYDGRITQMVRENQTAWHVSCYNSRSIGYEHEGYAAQSHPQTQYDASGDLSRDICNRWGIPKQKRTVGPGILGHHDVTLCCCGSHTDPDPGWDWTYYMARVANAPTITQQPQPRSVCPGATATFTVAATGSGTLTYRWQKNDVNLSNAGHYSGVTTTTLTVSNASSTDAANYRCVVTGSSGSVNSNEAALTLKPATVITQHPVSQMVLVGSPVQFTIAATGDGALTYQWQKDGINLIEGGRCTGTTSATLTIANCDGSDAAAYGCVVHGGCGNATSVSATLVLKPLVPADFDADRDVDVADLVLFLPCLTGAGVSPPVGCEYSDIDQDGDVDASDFGLLQRCLSGPSTYAVPHCADSP